MNLKIIFKKNVFKENNDKSFSINIQEINVMLKILKDKKKQFLVIKEKLYFSLNKINDTI